MAALLHTVSEVAALAAALALDLSGVPRGVVRASATQRSGAPSESVVILLDHSSLRTLGVLDRVVAASTLITEHWTFSTAGEVRGLRGPTLDIARSGGRTTRRPTLSDPPLVLPERTLCSILQDALGYELSHDLHPRGHAHTTIPREGTAYAGLVVIKGVALAAVPPPQVRGGRSFSTFGASARLVVAPAIRLDHSSSPACSWAVGWQLSFPLADVDAATALARSPTDTILVEVQKRCSGWHEPIPELLDATIASSIRCTAVQDYDPTLRLPQRGPAGDKLPESCIEICLGNAAHPLSVLHELVSPPAWRTHSFSWASSDCALRDAVLLAGCFRRVATPSLLPGQPHGAAASGCDIEAATRQFCDAMARRYSPARWMTEREDALRRHSLASLDDLPVVADLPPKIAPSVLRECLRRHVGAALGDALLATFEAVALEVVSTSAPASSSSLASQASVTLLRPSPPAAAAESADPLPCILGFYVYADISGDREVVAEVLRKSGARLRLGGSIRVGRDGLNASVEGSRSALREFAAVVRNLPQLSECPAVDFKLVSATGSDGSSALGGSAPTLSLNGHIKDAGLLVKIAEELVALKFPREAAHWVNAGISLSPRDFHAALLRMPPRGTGSQSVEADVLIDVRNGYETDIGRFAPPPGVELLLPGTRTFSEVSQ